MQFNLKSLPEYHIENNVHISSRLHRLPKVVRPLTDQFPSEEGELGPDEKNWSMTVQVKSDGRHVEVNQKPAGGERSGMLRIGKQLCASLSAALQHQKALIAKTKLHLRQREVLSRASNQPSQQQEKGFDVEADLSLSAKPGTDSEVSLTEHPSSGDAARGAERRKWKRPSGQEQTWKLLDHALYQTKKARSQQDNDVMPKKLSSEEKAQFVRKQIPLEPVEELMDPRLPVVVDLPRAELDLPIPPFGSLAAKENDVSGAEGRSPRPINVVIGIQAGGDSAVVDDDSASARHGLMESVCQRLHMLEVLSDVEYIEAITYIQMFIDSRMAKHHAEQRQLASSYCPW